MSIKVTELPDDQVQRLLGLLEGHLLDLKDTGVAPANGKVRELCHLQGDWVARRILHGLEERNLIKRVPGTRTSDTAYRKPVPADDLFSLSEARRRADKETK